MSVYQKAFKRGYEAGWSLVIDDAPPAAYNPYDGGELREQFQKGFVAGCDTARAWIESGACADDFDSLAMFARVALH